MPYNSPAAGVAETLQSILTRKRAESRQNFLDNILSRKTDSEISGQESENRGREALGAYYGKMGENIDFDNTRTMAGDVAPEAQVSNLAPNVAQYLRGISATGPGPTASVETAILDENGNPTEQTEMTGTPGPERYLGNQAYRDKQAMEGRRAALIADPKTVENMSPLQRALVLQQAGAAGAVPDDVANQGNIFSMGPRGQITKGPSIVGPNMLGQLGFDPADTARAGVNARAALPDWNITPGRDPKSGSMGNFIWDKNSPFSGAVPTFLGEAAKSEGTDPSLLNNFANASGGDKANPEAARILRAGIMQNASPAVQDVVNRVTNGTYTPKNVPLVLAPLQRAALMPSPSDDPMTKATKIGNMEGLSPAEIKQLAEYLTMFPATQ